MNCSNFERWLDEGMPVADETAATLHSRGCGRCAAALRAASELDSLLVASPPRSPARLVDRVMERIERAESACRRAPARAYVPAPRETIPWWIEWAADPAVALAFCLAALLGWRGEWLWAEIRGLEWSGWWASWSGGVLDHSLAWFTVPRSPLTENTTLLYWLALAILPLVFLAAFHLYHWSEGLTNRGRRTGGPVGP
jgi:hypothetical protein